MTDAAAPRQVTIITGASRGIGLAIGLRVARDGANIVIAAKTAEPHKKLPGTIFSAAEEVEKAGGKALPVVVDVREPESVQAAVDAAVERFGGIDICVNNASAIQLTGTLATDFRRYDLMNQVNARGTFVTTRICLPHLLKASNPHVLMLSPPLDMSPRWFAGHVAYTMAKYGMSMCVLGHAAEFRPYGVAVNALWPRTVIYTAALQMIPGIKPEHCRTADIMADAAYQVFISDAKTTTGNFFIDDEVLKTAGITDLSKYSVVPGSRELVPDLFL